MSEVLPYRSGPQHPYQRYLRRAAPKGAAPLASRLDIAEEVMGPGGKLYIGALESLALDPETQQEDLVGHDWCTLREGLAV